MRRRRRRPRRRLPDAPMRSTPPARYQSGGRGVKAGARRSAERGASPAVASIPAVDAVVPSQADRLRAGAAPPPGGTSAVAWAVEEPRASASRRSLRPSGPAGRPARSGEVQSPLACASATRSGRRTVLERERDALTHQRVDAGGVADQQRVRRASRGAGVVGADGERLPRPGRRPRRASSAASSACSRAPSTGGSA